MINSPLSPLFAISHFSPTPPPEDLFSVIPRFQTQLPPYGQCGWDTVLVISRSYPRAITTVFICLTKLISRLKAQLALYGECGWDTVLAISRNYI